MLLKTIFACSLTALSFGTSAQPVSIVTMHGQCQGNSQLTRTSAEQLAAKVNKHQLYKCNTALITELANGRVVIHVSQKDSSDNVIVGYAGYYAGPVDPTNRYVEVDGMYFIGQNFDKNRQNAKGHCEIKYKEGKVTSLACLSGTKLEAGDLIVSSAVFKPSDYSIEKSQKSDQTQKVKSPREPWYGVSASGGKCVPTDMSPAERIEWLRERGVKYDAIDYAGPSVNGRVPKVTIIPKNGNYPTWVYYGSQSFCEVKETYIEKYR